MSQAWRTLSKNGLHRSLSACAAVVFTTGAAASSSIVYSENFAGCSGGGYALTSLWHPAALGGCAPAGLGCGLYFGEDATCNFATGFTVAGNADSPAIDLTTCIAPITLRFDYRIGTEGLPCSYDIARVRVSDNGFATSTVVADPGCTAPTTLIENAGWQSATVDLSAWAGSTIQLRYAFDSVDASFNSYFGFAVTNVEVEAAKPTQLALEGIDCQDDAYPSEPGHQVAVSVWMRSVDAPGATGFQAFVEFDDGLLGYRDDLSSYTAGPFPLHILNFGAIPPFHVQWAAGRLRLDGSSLPFDPPAAGDAPLATLVFDVLDECATTALDFGGYPATPVFFSELSLFGTPLTTILTPTDPLRLDDTAPVITCPSDVTVAADVSIWYPICAASNCCSAHAGTGCSDAACTANICGFDSFCCLVLWDSICASEAATSCGPAQVQDPCVGAVVTFSATATDNCDLSPNVVCSPPSGSLFPIGTTTVTCTATDDCGNADVCTFDVTVTPTNEIVVDLKILVGSFTGPSATRCIHFQTDDCAAATDESLFFADDGLGYQATGPVTIEIPCGDWSTLCVKDEQHSKWQTVALVNAGSYWLATPQVVLLPGDDDNDGDVDINDVTWLIFTFGGVAGVDPCPFTFPGPGPRDADFSLNGVVSGEDYSLLTDQFLTFSSCACTLPAVGDPEQRFDRRRSLSLDEIDARIRGRVDLNRDGIFDADDVTIFENQRGLPNGLSTKLRGEPATRVRSSTGRTP